MSRPQSPSPAARPKPIPLRLLVDRALVGAVAALVVARPLVAGDDPGRLRLTAGGGPVSLDFLVFLLTAFAGAWRIVREPNRRVRWLWAPLLLAAVGVAAFISSRLPNRYAHPGVYVGWEWIALGATYFLTRRVASSSADTRGILNVFLATAVSIAGLGVYQALTKPLGLPSTEVAVKVSTGLVGDDEFYPELNEPSAATKQPRGTFDSPGTFLSFLFLSLPLALAVARAGRGRSANRWLFAIPVVLGAGALAAVLTRPLGEGAGYWSGAFGAIEHHPLFGVGPGNYTRAVIGQSSAHGAWWELTATTGLIGLALFIAALASALKQAWPTSRSAAPEGPVQGTHWEFYIGGTGGLVLGFIWAFGAVPAEAPATEIMNLGSAAIYRAVLWFAAFALLEKTRASSGAIVRAILVGAGIVLLIGVVSDYSGRTTLLSPLFVLLALAANLARPDPAGLPGAWDKPLRVAGVICSACLVVACLVTAGLPAWSTANAVRQARMASRHFPDKHRDFEAARFGSGRAKALASARGFLIANILNPLYDAAERDPRNAALFLELARMLRYLWQYELIADPEKAAKVAVETRRLAERAGQLDPNNLAAKRSLFEALLLFRKNSKVRQPERIAAMNKLIGQIAEREPTAEVPLRYRMVQMLLDRGNTEGVDAEAALLLRLDGVKGAPHGHMSADQREEIIRKTLRKWSWWWVS